MKKIFIIFGVLSLLIFIRPALGLGTNSSSGSIESSVKTEQVEKTAEVHSYDGAFKGIKQFYNRYIVKGIPLSLISEGALDRDSNFYPAPNRTRNSTHKNKNKTPSYGLTWYN